MTSNLVRLTHDLSVNRDLVSSVEWDRTYNTRLVVTMANGTAHSIKHEPGYTGGIDCYKIEKELLNA